MGKTIVFTVLFLFLFSSTYAKELDRHRFGFSIEGGYSYPKSRFEGMQMYYPEDFKGNFGGTLFYQYNFLKYFAIRPEIGLYSYFFGLPVDYSEADHYSTYKVTYATFNGRVGAGLVFYYYKNKAIAIHITITPSISMRFYDSANLYVKSSKESLFSETSDVKSERLYYVSGGVTISSGVETANFRTVGFGGAVFMRFADKPTNESDKTIIIPSFGLSLSMFF